MAGSVGDAIVGAGCAVVQKLCDFGIGGGGSGGLFGVNFGEHMEEFVVNGAGILEEGSHDALDKLDAVVLGVGYCLGLVCIGQWHRR